MRKFLQSVLASILFIGISITMLPNNIVKAEEHQNSINIEAKSSSPRVITGRWKIASKLDNNKLVSANSNNVFIWDNEGNDTQVWEFEHYADEDMYTIKNVHTGKYLTWDTKNGRNVFTTSPSSHYNYEQFWHLFYYNDGYFTFSNYKDRNLKLDIYGGNTTNGTNIQVHERAGAGDNQLFKLIPVDTKPEIIPGITTGVWQIASKLNNEKVLDVSNATMRNVSLW